MKTRKPFCKKMRVAALSSLYATCAAGALLSACGGGESVAASNLVPAADASNKCDDSRDNHGNSRRCPVALTCDNSMITAFKPDANTTVTLVKAFKKGDPLALSGTPATPAPPVALNDMCLVKLTIGPGNPGPAGALSTSSGIHVEVWLPSPAKWNGRIHNITLGGFGGNAIIGNTTLITTGTAPFLTGVTWGIAMNEGAVSAVNDGGHADPAGTGSFAMNPDGTINSTLWTDVSTRATHEMTLKTKALVKAYYLTAQSFSYVDGCSGGGRQGFAEAQNFPDDYDGILAGAPSIAQTRFFPADLYPGFVQLKDLGSYTALTAGQLALVSGAAVSACDTTLTGQHDGYIADPTRCTYDPTTDPSVLCTSSGGTNTTANCVSTAQANTFNKAWYGPTSDGTAPAPAAPTIAANSQSQALRKRMIHRSCGLQL